MINAYTANDNVNAIVKGSVEEILAEFSFICASLANVMTEGLDLTEDQVTKRLAMKMAEGISKREDVRKVGE